MEPTPTGESRPPQLYQVSSTNAHGARVTTRRHEAHAAIREAIRLRAEGHTLIHIDPQQDEARDERTPLYPTARKPRQANLGKAPRRMEVVGV